MNRWARASWRVIAALIACCVVACADADEPSEPPAVQLGTGEWQFEPLASDQRVMLYAGTQGGYHVWVSLRARGFSGERLRMQLALRSDGSAPLARSDLELVFEPPPDGAEGWLEHVGWPAQLLSPWCAVELPLTIDATVSDAHGHSATSSIRIVPTAPVHGFGQSCESP